MEASRHAGTEALLGIMDQTKRLLIRLGKRDEADVGPEIIFSSTNLTRLYFPGRGVVPSAIVHILACFALFFPTVLRTFILSPPPPDQVVFIDLNDPRTVMYLPPLQGSAPQPAAKRKPGAEDEEPAPKAGNEGLTYPGLQPILSDIPEATNSIQTILRPDIENPPKLVLPFPVPNIVQTEETSMVVQSPLQMPEIQPAGPERLQPDTLASPADRIPDPLYAPSEDFPELEIPDLQPIPATEQEMAFLEPEMAPIERVRPSIPESPVDAPAVKSESPSGNFPKMKIPGQMRASGPETNLTLPETEIVPMQRVRPSIPESPVDAPATRTEAPSGNFPKMKIPGQMRANRPETNLTLPETEIVPMQRVRPSIPESPVDAPAVKSESPSGNFPKMNIPDQMRATGPETDLRLPETEIVPMQRTRPSIPESRANAQAARSDSPSGNFPKMKIPGQMRVTDPKTEAKAEASTANEWEDESSTGDGERILSLTPMPVLPAFQIEIPEGEARGSFAISADPNLATPSIEPGAKSEKAPDRKAIEPITLGTANNAGTLAASSDVTGNTDRTAETNDDSQGPFLRVLTGNGENAFDGITIVDGSKHPVASGDPTSITPMDDSDDGIEVIGGRLARGNAAALTPVEHPPTPIQTDYYLSIITTEHSGSVLDSADFFKNTIYTVYLDMRESIDEVEQHWIFEFGLISDEENNPDLSLDSENYTEGLLLPFPYRKKHHQFSEALVRKYRGRMIRVSGIVNAEGRMKQHSILDNPDPDLTEGLLETLATWIFRPARLNGQPISVKFMLGIPF